MEKEIQTKEDLIVDDFENAENIVEESEEE